MPSINWSDHSAAAFALANNWRSFDSFINSDDELEDGDWTVVYTSNRDAALLTQSNHAYMSRILTQYAEVKAITHKHWACGWVEGFAIKVYHNDGSLTAAFREYCDLMARLDDYPVLDEEDLSERETDADYDNVKDFLRYEIHLYDLDVSEVISEVLQRLNDSGDNLSWDDIRRAFDASPLCKRDDTWYLIKLDPAVIDHTQYFLGGFGAASVGTGSTPMEAANDALDILAQDGYEINPGYEPSRWEHPDNGSEELVDETGEPYEELFYYVRCYLKEIN